MKKQLLSVVFGVTILMGMPLISHAASFAEGVNGEQQGDSTATATLEESDDDIRLVSAPDFKFGSTKIDGHTHKSVPTTSVTDDVKVINPGKLTGWKVSVQAGDFVSEDNKSIMKDAQLHLQAGTVTSEDSYDSYGVVSLATDPNASPQPIFNATEGNGLGTWELRHSEYDATLDIPGSAVSGEYTAKLAWTLVNTPE